MEKFKNGDYVIRTQDEKSIIIIVSWANGDNRNTFQGTVVHNDFESYMICEHSRTWHESKFELAPKGLTITLTT